ncbi:hypothetical protein N9B14_04360 [Akkermansiaceae bacterium]|nr:hypothetical protein [Akkermansiaceae bacterium]
MIIGFAVWRHDDNVASRLKGIGFTDSNESFLPCRFLKDAYAFCEGHLNAEFLIRKALPKIAEFDFNYFLAKFLP